MMTILVVEDEIALQNIIKDKLINSGFSVETVNSVEAALDVVRKTRIDAIWLDHYLNGELSGLDLVVGLKNDEKYKSIPIFVVSNTASPDKLKNYIGLGVDKYYIKSDATLSDIVKDISERIKIGEQNNA
jgi:CheY-like chemotaxis protein